MWTFEQSTGRFLDADFTLVGKGYAGRDYDDAGTFVGGKNNPAKEGVKGIGPLPVGNYHATSLILLHPKLGKNVIQLTPDAPTRARIIAYGRDPESFFFHGDSIEHPGLASHGCIVQSPDVRIDSFWKSTDHDISVIHGPMAFPDIDGEICV